MHDSRKRLGWLALAAILVLVGLWLVDVAANLASTKPFSVDEFQYAHGAWLISQGKVIYRDFFEHHFPLIHQLLAIPFLALGTHPGSIVVLRFVMLAFLAVLLASAGYLNRRRDRITGWITPLVLLGTGSLVGMAVEIRPDVAVFALFLAGVAVLSSDLGARARGFVAGALISLAGWGTLKVAYYGMAVVAALVSDLVMRRGESIRDHEHSRSFLGSWRAFVLGVATVVGVVVVYLTVTRSWDTFYRWCIAWSFVHQENYPARPWLSNFLPLLSHHTWLFVFGGVGVATTLRKARSDSGAAASTDVLLVGLLATTLASTVWQTAPYVYSFVPFLAMVGVFAARGLVATYRSLGSGLGDQPRFATFGLVLVTLLLVGETLHVRTLFRQALNYTNEAQLETLDRLDRIAAPDDTVFDISGMRVTRPGVHYYYFMDAAIRQLKADQIAREIPQGILDTGCSVYLHDERFGSFPPSLQEFLLENFQPLDGTIWLWGRRFRSQGEDLQDSFTAVRSGRYFVTPAAVAESGELRIDGKVASSGVSLARGTYTVEYTGSAGSFYILWEPPTGRYEPQPNPLAP